MPKRLPIAKPRVGFGAEGIGLCRTEHMFFEASRISAVREMILADDEDGRRTALESCCPNSATILPRFSARWRACHARSACSIRRCMSFCRRAMQNLPNWPNDLDVGEDHLRRRAANCTNSTRCWAIAGAALGITFPEIYEMQARAIFEAACTVTAEGR